jgi:putative oxidoreductase
MRALARQAAPVDAALLWLRVSGSALLLAVHGWPKLVHYQAELARIEDPFGFGAPVSLTTAIVAEVLCPLLIACGLFTRAACAPVLLVLAVALLAVHPDWTFAQGQFGWLLVVIFVTIALAGPGRWSIDARIGTRARWSRRGPAGGSPRDGDAAT